LKQIIPKTTMKLTKSPPARGRGLKHDLVLSKFPALVVAPRTGAWIETQPPPAITGKVVVAPRTGAWIETSS